MRKTLSPRAWKEIDLFDQCPVPITNIAFLFPFKAILYDNGVFRQFENAFDRNPGHTAVVDRTIAKHARRTFDRLSTTCARDENGAVVSDRSVRRSTSVLSRRRPRYARVPYRRDKQTYLAQNACASSSWFAIRENGFVSVRSMTAAAMSFSSPEPTRMTFASKLGLKSIAQSCVIFRGPSLRTRICRTHAETINRSRKGRHLVCSQSGHVPTAVGIGKLQDRFTIHHLSADEKPSIWRPDFR